MESKDDDRFERDNGVEFETVPDYLLSVCIIAISAGCTGLVIGLLIYHLFLK